MPYLARLYPDPLETMAGTENQTNNLQEVPEGFRVVDDRRFKKEPKYLLPTDEAEMNRLNYQHYVIKHLRHGNFSAPMNELLGKGITVLDAGCGSGQWTLDMAKNYPNSTFYATDYAEMFPTVNVPSNVTFLKANTLERLPFPDNTFDYVFQRLLFFAFSPSDWEKAMNELVRVTKPGGCVELLESNFKYPLAPPLFTPICESIHDISLKRGVEIGFIDDNMGDFLTKYGLTSVVSDFFSAPIGWDGYSGELMLKNTEFFMNSMKSTLMPHIGLSDSEWDEMSQTLLNEIGKGKYKMYTNLPYGYGFKPL